MKNTSFFEKVKCIVSNECHSDREYINEDHQQEIQTESIEESFHPFDIDDVFAN